MKPRIFLTAVLAVAAVIGGTAQANDLQAIRAKGKIIIGTLGTDEPSSFLDAKTRQLVGYEIDLGKAVAKAIGVKPVFKQISVAARIPELKQGRVDLLAASLTRTPARAKEVTFTNNTFVTGQVALVKKSSGIKHVAQLADKRVLTVRGGTQQANILKAVPSADVVTFETTQQAFMALRQGKGAAFVDDQSALLNYYGKLGDKKKNYRILPENLSIEPLAMAVRKGDTALKKIVNETLAKLEHSGKAEKLFLKWYGPGTKTDLQTRNFRIDTDKVALYEDKS